MNRFRRVNFVTATILTAWLTPAGAGLFDDPQNLQALPQDISPQMLSETMRNFATDTGSRCSSCHVHEVEADLSTYDFPADDKEKKRKARQMIRMVADINAFIAANIGSTGAAHVKVECATCHRGLEKPELLHDVVEETYRAEGIEPAIARYRELRQRYYGTAAYEFAPRELMIVAESVAAAEEYGSAIRFLDLNLEYHPEYARALVLKASFLVNMGNREAARENLLRAIELEPDNPWNRQALENLDKGSE